MDLAAPFELDPQVALRPEPFGALAYHFGTRRLSFLRSPDIVAVVTALGAEPDVRSALTACDIAAERWPSFEAALGTLEASGMIRPRAGEEVSRVA